MIIKLQTSVRVEAGMQSKDAALATITLLGRAIKVTAETRLTDRLANASQPAAITLASLNVGDRLEVQAYKDGSANLCGHAGSSGPHPTSASWSKARPSRSSP